MRLLAGPNRPPEPCKGARDVHSQVWAPIGAPSEKRRPAERPAAPPAHEPDRGPPKAARAIASAGKLLMTCKHIKPQSRHSADTAALPYFPGMAPKCDLLCGNSLFRVRWLTEERADRDG